MDGCMDEWTGGYGWMDGRIDGEVDRWNDGWTGAEMK